MYPFLGCLAVIARVLLLGLAKMCYAGGISTRVESGSVWYMTAKVFDWSGNLAISDVSLELEACSIE